MNTPMNRSHSCCCCRSSASPSFMFSPSLCLIASSDQTNGRPITEVVEEALKNGATIVQLREKKLTSRQFIQVAEMVKKITDKYHVPLIINDKVEVALAVGASGVHVGQDDINADTVRRLIGPDKILGVTVSDENEALKAFNDGADYLGTNAIFPTQTKKDTPVLGISKFRSICESTSLPVMGIGGVNDKNAGEVINAGASGVAVVSAICSAPHVGQATSLIKKAVDLALPKFSEEHAKFAANALRKIRSSKPLIQHLTNYVVMNDTANVTILTGARPVMAHENEEITPHAAALVINMGTLDDRWATSFQIIGKAANLHNVPIVFDPVGAGASRFRTGTAKSLLANLNISILKGNPGEIGTLAGADVVMSGVDSLSGSSNLHQSVKQLAKEGKYIVVMTGKHDIISDGQTVLEVHNNSQFLSTLTGTGCSATSVIAAFLAVEKENPLQAAASAMAFFCYAAEVAQRRVKKSNNTMDDEPGGGGGPGKFKQELYDALYSITPEQLEMGAKIVVYSTTQPPEEEYQAKK